MICGMSDGPKNIHCISDDLPPPDELRIRLANNLKEGDLLRKALRLAERAQKVKAEQTIGGEDGR